VADWIKGFLPDSWVVWLDKSDTVTDKVTSELRDSSGKHVTNNQNKTTDLNQADTNADMNETNIYQDNRVLREI